MGRSLPGEETVKDASVGGNNLGKGIGNCIYLEKNKSVSIVGV